MAAPLLPELLRPAVRRYVLLRPIDLLVSYFASYPCFCEL